LFLCVSPRMTKHPVSIRKASASATGLKTSGAGIKLAQNYLKESSLIRDVPTVFRKGQRAFGKVAPTQTKGPALICDSVEDMLQQKCRSYQALLVQRPRDRRNIQWHVDKFANCGYIGRELSVEKEVCPLGDPAKVDADLCKTAQGIATFAVRHGLPKDVGNQIQQDFVEIGRVMLKLVPTTKQVLLKLDVMGENSCSRWHRDRYVGRALVAYNSCGTHFVDESNVNSMALEYGGMNANKLIVQDESKILDIDVGDIFFMKGTLFPDTPNGLVHRSPPTQWHADGRVVHRLLLKVDLN